MSKPRERKLQRKNLKRRTQTKETLLEKRALYKNIFSEKLEVLKSKVSIILVAPKYEGNIGAIARLMRNYGLDDLRMVHPPYIGDEAIARAMNGKDLLLGSSKFDSLEDATEGFQIVAATSSEMTMDDRRFRRLPETPESFWRRALKSRGKIALVFGREDDGLRNGEIELCNSFIHVPANPEYPVLNLSHAVSIILYEMIRDIDKLTPEISDTADEFNLGILTQKIMEIMDLSGYPEYKRTNAHVMISRLLARSNITESEYFKIMGILRFLRFRLKGVETDKDTPEKLY